MRTRYLILTAIILVIIGALLKDLTSLIVTPLLLIIIGCISTIVLSVVTYLDDRIEF